MWGELIYRSSIFFDSHITPIPIISISIRIGIRIFILVSITYGVGLSNGDISFFIYIKKPPHKGTAKKVTAQVVGLKLLP